MAFRKRTIRRLPPITKRVANIIAKLESAKRKLRNLMPEIEEMEKDKKIQALKDRQTEMFEKDPF